MNEAKIKGQRKAILEHLKKNHSITSMEAFQLYGVTRLAAIIFDFRVSGYNIVTHTMEGQTRYGTSAQYAKYVLREGER